MTSSDPSDDPKQSDQIKTPSGPLDAKARAALGKKLYRACERGDVAKARELLAQGANPNMRHREALGVAALAGKAECVAELIPVSNMAACGFAALLWAAIEGHGRCVELLLPHVDPLGRERDLTVSEWARAKGQGAIADMIDSHVERQALGHAVEAAPEAARAPRL